jgi:hypothetical protein
MVTSFSALIATNCVGLDGAAVQRGRPLTSCWTCGVIFASFEFGPNGNRDGDRDNALEADIIDREQE